MAEGNETFLERLGLDDRGAGAFHAVFANLVGDRQLRGQIAASFKDFAKTLNEKERTIFEERLLNDDKHTLNDIAEKLSLSRERVRQIEVRIKEKLKQFLIDRFGESVVEVIL